MATREPPAPGSTRATFRLPVERIREGYYSDAYFNFTKELLEAEGHHPRVTMQVFQKEQSVARRDRRGDRGAQAVLRRAATDGRGSAAGTSSRCTRSTRATRSRRTRPVMTIEGDYALFAHLETVYLGCLARRTLIMRNVREVVEAARGKPILFFPARHDHWLVQTGDGWAAHVAGAIGVSTDAQASWWGGAAIGTVPHGADRRLRRRHGRGRRGVRRPLRGRDERDRAGRLRERLGARRRSRWPTRSATGSGACGSTPPSASWTARCWDEMGDFKPDRRERRACRAGSRRARRRRHERVRIVGLRRLRRRRIREFEAARASPVDSYGVGSSLLRGPNDFTADVVRLEGRPCAKVGPRVPPQPAPGTRDLRTQGRLNGRSNRDDAPVPAPARCAVLL